MVLTPGWQRFSDKVKQEAKDIGFRAVYPMIDDSILKETLIRANEAYRIVIDIERKATKLEELEDRAAVVKNLP